MKPAAFAYCAPTCVAEALEILAERGADARIIAGGQTLGPMLNMRIVTPSILVDINRIADLPPLTFDKQRMRAGALVRQREAFEHAEVGRRMPVLRRTLSHVGHYQTRTRGTLCGSIAHADPTAELPLLLLTLGGSVLLASKRRRRTVAAGEFFLGSLATAREPEEMILALDWPTGEPAVRHSFEEITVRHGHVAVAACAAAARLDPTGNIASLSLGFTGTSDRPSLVETAAFLNAKPDQAWRTAIVAHVRSAIPCIDDAHASAAYRRHVAGWLAERALATVTAPTTDAVE